MPSPSAPPVIAEPPVRIAASPRRPLVGWAYPAGTLVSATGVLLVAMSVYFFHGADTRPDQRIYDALTRHISRGAAHAIIHVTDPPYAVALLAIVVVVALVRRHLDLALLAVAGPAVAVLLSSEVLKPLLGRDLDLVVLTRNPYAPAVPPSFPSGHETGVTATAWVLLIAVCRLTARWTVRIAAVVVLAGWVALAAIALTRNAYHYASDTVGGFCVATAIVLGLALAIDHRPRRRRAVLV